MPPKTVVVHPTSIHRHTLPPRRRPTSAGRWVALILVLVIACSGAALFSLMRLPQWRAERARLALGTGLKAAAVEQRLAGLRFEAVYQERMAVGWRRLERKDFLESFAGGGTRQRGQRRMRLTFRGPLGNSAALLVEFNAAGEITAVRAPGDGE